MIRDISNFELIFPSQGGYLSIIELLGATLLACYSVLGAVDYLSERNVRSKLSRPIWYKL